MENKCSEHSLVGSRSILLPSIGSPSQNDQKNSSVELSHYPDKPRLARDTLVFGLSTAVNGNPTLVSIVNTPKTGSQPSVSQQSTIPQPSCLVSRSEQLQEHRFSVEVAWRIAKKWVLFQKWCRENLVYFSPSVKQVSDFFMFLLQDLNRRRSTLMATGLLID